MSCFINYKKIKNNDKKVITLIVTLSLSVTDAQEMRKIVNDKYEIKVPSTWRENKAYFSSSMSLMILKQKSAEEPDPVEAIVMKHVAAQKINLEEAYQEYLGLLKGYYGTNFKILNKIKKWKSINFIR